MTKHYPETSTNPELPALETTILKQWDDANIFEQSVDMPAGKAASNDEFVFYDGPPFANGLPHYGHLLTSYVKDIFARYHTMKGEKCERRFGWDCHGLPAEMAAEKELGVSGRKAIEDFGIAKFNDHCRSSVMKYTDEWQDYVDRAARWVDFENDYKTMDTSYMESVLWAFKSLFDKGLVYESYRVMPYSWAAQTPLSNFETRMDDSYRERTDKAITVAFELNEAPASAPGGCSRYCVLAWTTTPWTLPSNLALAINPDMDYVALEIDDHEDDDGMCVVLAKSALKTYAKELGVAEDELEIFQSFKGSELAGLNYKPLFPYFDYLAKEPSVGAEPEIQKYVPEGGTTLFSILAADFVEEGSGTGIVHLAPAFGEDDQEICSKAGIPNNICPVDEAGCYTEKEIYDLPLKGKAPRTDQIFSDDQRWQNCPSLSLKGLNVIAQTEGKSDDEPYNEKQLEKYGLANLRIITWLKLTGKLIKQEDYAHSYPHCWRTDMPIIYKAVSSWYVEVTKFKDRMVELNQNINWIPEHIKDGQFGKWLEGARDWSISRNRYWGCPIPVWRGDKGGIKVFGSIEELESFFETKVEDLHRPFIDELTITKDGETWTRVSDVFDCWFESGSMPYAQVHYPFENKQWFEDHFPADFIVEYVGQTRGWFYTLMVLSTALFDREPFKNCICHGIILAEDGKKLSKRLKNYPDPNDMFDAYGSDAVRMRMVKEPIMQGGNLLISKDGSCIRDVVRLSIKPLWNAYHFFSLYANADGMKAYNLLELADLDEDTTSPGQCCGGAHGNDAHPLATNMLDRYILAKLKATVQTIGTALDGYDTPTACSAFDRFFDVLNNWYIRRNRDRFWREKGTDADDKQAAYNTLYTVLVTMCQAMAPLMPLVTEHIFKALTGQKSVHLQSFPDVSAINVDADLATAMDRVQQVCTSALAIRDAENIRIRQPLASLTVYAEDAEQLTPYAEIIQDELNVKQVNFSSELAKVATRKLQVNFPVVGKRLGAQMKALMPLVGKGEWSLNDNGTLAIGGEELAADEFSLALQSSIAKGAAATAQQDMLVALDLELSDDLVQEGLARDVVRAIQQARKEADLNVADRIYLQIDGDDDVVAAAQTHQAYIASQTLASEVGFGAIHADHHSELEIEGRRVRLGFSVAKAQAAAS